MDYSEPGSSTNWGPPSTGLTWTNAGPMFRMDDAIVETVVTHTTRTTTSFAPIVLPRLPPPDSISLPRHLVKEEYPLADQPAPADMQFFNVTLGGRRVTVQDDTAFPALEGPLRVSGPGWTRTLPASTYVKTQMPATPQLEERTGFLDAVNRYKGKEARKRPHASRSISHVQPDRAAFTPPGESGDTASIDHLHSPPRKKIRGIEDTMAYPGPGASSLLSPLPSPDHEAGPSTPRNTRIDSTLPSLGSGVEFATLMSLPNLVNHFDNMPERLQQHLLMHLLRRSRMPTIQRVATFAGIALKRDFISLLPTEVAVQILRAVDRTGLAAAQRVCKRWKRMIDSNRSIWRQRLVDDGLWYGHGVEEEEEAEILERYETLDFKAEYEAKSQRRGDTPSDDEMMLSATLPARSPVETVRPAPLKHVYRRRVQNRQYWTSMRPSHTSFPGHGTNVVTCLQFDDDRIISASDEHAINVYNKSDGGLRKRLEGHGGGVWTLQSREDSLVSGSTDRTVRIWNLETLTETHVFHGHESTVRCLQIVEPVWDPVAGEFTPAFPVIVTGSRDKTLRVWQLPTKDDAPLPRRYNDAGELLPIAPAQNPFHIRALEGHGGAVRALSAHGRTCVSASYDNTARVWDITTGKCEHVLAGHEAKVYSVAYDRYRKRCASGSMDNTVRVWDTVTGECLQVLTGHTSLVGLLGFSPNYLVSAAADASLRVWDANTLQLKSTLTSHTGAITCFQHDEAKVISGSDGSLKIWDSRNGNYVRDLVVGIHSVWQVMFKGNVLVVASSRGGQTGYDVFDFGATPFYAHDVDDPELDSLRLPAWERELEKRYQSALYEAADEWEMPNSPTPSVHPLAQSPMDRWNDGTLSMPRGSAHGQLPHLDIGQSPSPTQQAQGSTRRSTRLARRESLPARPNQQHYGVTQGARKSHGRKSLPAVTASVGSSKTSSYPSGSAATRGSTRQRRQPRLETASAMLTVSPRKGSLAQPEPSARRRSRGEHISGRMSAAGSSFIPDLEEVDADESEEDDTGDEEDEDEDEDEDEGVDEDDETDDELGETIDVE
ncbi:hypothetical protein IAU60_005590 [Kwoniella sp. DSM 27419]